MTPNTPTLKLLSAARELTDEVIFQSEPMKIGKNYWIFVLYYDSLYKKVFNGFHFHDEHYERCFPCDEWKMEKNHPKYNHHDGTYAGLPKTLVKLYEKYEKLVLQVRKVTSKEDALTIIKKYENKNTQQTLF